MKFYLSSYRLGNETGKLLEMIPVSKRNIGYIPNALDFTSANPEKVEEQIAMNIAALTELGLQPELLDLKEYFGKKEELRKKIDELGGVWINGGNVFVLRQAMKISGFDQILLDVQLRDDFVYGGYSAAGCVLSPTLKGYQIVDDATDLPYENQKEIIWEGIGLIDFVFLPHFDSDHPESADIDKEVQYCIDSNIPYKTLRDGEVLIIE